MAVGGFGAFVAIAGGRLPAGGFRFAIKTPSEPFAIATARLDPAGLAGLFWNYTHTTCMLRGDYTLAPPHWCAGGGGVQGGRRGPPLLLTGDGRRTVLSRRGAACTRRVCSKRGLRRIEH